MPRIPRKAILEKFRGMIARGEPIVGGGAGTGLSAKCEEAGGIDLIVIYNSGRYRMAGRGSLAGLLAYGNANEIVVEMAREVLPVVKNTPVLAGVNGTDPFMLTEHFLAQLAALGFSGVQNFPTVGLIDGIFRKNLEETGMGYGLEVEMIRKANQLDLLTTPYVFSEGEAEAMAKAGADIIVCHMGLTTGGSIGAETALTLADCVPRITAWAAAARAVAQGRDRALPWRPDLHAGGRHLHSEALPGLSRLLRRLQHGAAADGDRAHRADAEVQEDQTRVTAGKPACLAGRRGSGGGKKCLAKPSARSS